MGDSASQNADDSKTFPQPGENLVPGSKESLHADGSVRKGQQEPLLQQGISQAPHIHGQQYGPQYQPLQTRPDSFNLSQLGTALPDPSYQNYGQMPQRFPSAAGPSGLVYSTQNNSHYAAPQAMSPTTAQYPYQAQFQGAYIAANQQPVVGMGNQFYHPGYIGRQQHHGATYISQPSQFPLHNQAYPVIQQPASWGPRGSVSEESRTILPQRLGGGQAGSDSIGKKLHGCQPTPNHLL
jgi:hypothetical protein